MTNLNSCQVVQDSSGDYNEICSPKFSTWSILSIIFSTIAVICLIIYTAIEVYQRKKRNEYLKNNQLQYPMEKDLEKNWSSNSNHHRRTTYFAETLESKRTLHDDTPIIGYGPKEVSDNESLLSNSTVNDDIINHQKSPGYRFNNSQETFGSIQIPERSVNRPFNSSRYSC